MGFKHYSDNNYDRFIPNRSAMDFGYAQYMLTTKDATLGKQNDSSSAWSELYQKKLLEAADLPMRILAFRNKPTKPKNTLSPPPQSNPSKPRHIPQVTCFFICSIIILGLNMYLVPGKINT